MVQIVPSYATYVVHNLVVALTNPGSYRLRLTPAAADKAAQLISTVIKPLKIVANGICTNWPLWFSRDRRKSVLFKDKMLANTLEL